MTFTVSITPSGKTVSRRRRDAYSRSCPEAGCGAALRLQERRMRLLQGAHRLRRDHPGSAPAVSALTAEEATRGLRVALLRARRLRCDDRGEGGCGGRRDPDPQDAVPGVVHRQGRAGRDRDPPAAAGQASGCSTSPASTSTCCLRDGTRRSYSMATAPGTARRARIARPAHARGQVHRCAFGVVQPELKVRDILRLEGPLGTFFLREDSDKPIVMVASGTGFAPIKAIVEHVRGLIERQGLRPADDAVLGRAPAARPLHERAVRALGAEMPGFTLRAGGLRCPARGRMARPHRLRPSGGDGGLSRHERLQVYACGAPIVVDSSREDFITHCGLPAEEFYADAFVTAADAARRRRRALSTGAARQRQAPSSPR